MRKKTLEDITDVAVKESEICVFVRQDDPARYLQDAADYTFGIVADMEPDNVRDAVSQMETICGSKFSTSSYDTLPLLADALTAEKIDAIILPSAYVELYCDVEKYADFPNSIRVLETQTVVIREKSQKITKADKPLASASPARSSERFFTVCISGIDNRGGLIANSLSDVNVLAAVNNQTHEILLISIPRDYYVTRADSGKLDKLTHACMGGIENLQQTVSDLFGIPIDYYFRVNFGGFVNIINALGGVDVYSDYTFYFRGYQFYEGYNSLDGDAALIFCRDRSSFSSGDRQRGKNSVAMIKAVFNKVMTKDFLIHYSDVLNSVDGSFETSIPYDTIAGLVRAQLDDWQDWDIQSFSVDGRDSNDYCYSLGAYAYVMTPNMDTVNEAQSLIQQIKEGK